MSAVDKKITILQLFKAYKGNFPLHNELVRLDPERFRTIACYLDGRPDGRNDLESLAYRTEYLECKSSNQRWYNIPLLSRLKSLIESECVNIVNCQLHRTTPLGVIAASLATNRPLVLSSVHGMTTRTSMMKRMQNRLWDLGIYRYVAVSDAVKQSFLQGNPRLAPDQVTTIHNGLDLSRFCPPSENEKKLLRSQLFPGVTGDFWFGTAGRLSVVKNHAALLRAFQKMASIRPECRLLIAGQGELENELKSLGNSLGIADKIHFLGFRNDLPRVYQTLDGFVFPSLREGLPLALIEALAAGLPVVASRAGGIPEVVGEDMQSSLVPATDTDALAAAMLELAEIPATQRHAVGETLRKRAMEHFQAHQMARRYENLYESCYQFWLKCK